MNQWTSLFKEWGNHHLWPNNIKSSTGNGNFRNPVKPPGFGGKPMNFPSRPRHPISAKRPYEARSEQLQGRPGGVKNDMSHEKTLEYFAWYWLFFRDPLIGLLQFPILTINNQGFFRCSQSCFPLRGRIVMPPQERWLPGGKIGGHKRWETNWLRFNDGHVYQRYEYK